MLNRWIQDQNQPPVAAPSDVLGINAYAPPNIPSEMQPYAYLAYPDLGRMTLVSSAGDEVATLNSYDLVDDDDIPQNVEDYVVTEVSRIV